MYFIYLVKIGFKKEIKIKKNSERLLIVGAGESCNQMSKNDWIHFSDTADIAALSYGVFLPNHVDFFFFEPPFRSEYTKKYYYNYINEVVPKIQNLIEKKIIKNIFIKNISDEKSIKKKLNYKINTIFSWSIRTNILVKIIKIYKIFDFIGLTQRILIQKRTSISGIVSWAIANGYKEVIFCGIDLKSNTYYFENNKNFENYNFLSVGDNTLGKHSNMNTHPTSNKFGEIDLIDVLNEMCKRYDTEFYVTSKSSRLHEFLDIYEQRK